MVSASPFVSPEQKGEGPADVRKLRWSPCHPARNRFDCGGFILPFLLRCGWFEWTVLLWLEAGVNTWLEARTRVYGLLIRYIFVIVATPSLQRPVQARVKILNCLGGGAPISILCLRRASRAHCTLTSIFFRLTVGACKLHISELHGWFSLTAPSTDSWINPQAIKCADVQLATRQVAATLVLERLGIIVIITHQLTIAANAIYVRTHLRPHRSHTVCGFHVDGRGMPCLNRDFDAEGIT